MKFNYSPAQIRDNEITIKERFNNISWVFILTLTLLAGFGFIILYSIAGENMTPWASKQMIRFTVAIGVVIVIAVSDIRLWMKYSYLIYFASLVLVIAVAFMGTQGMGAQRWLNLGFIQIQPSELIKITAILALARYFHGATLQECQRTTYILPPLILLGIPVLFILKQPDLGTACMLIAIGAMIFILVGVQMWKFALVGAAGLMAIPVIWSFLKSYQKYRILTFLDPDMDPLGKGYHITQSKIALGSGGVFGKGFLQGTQSHLNFIPEIHTDFIFTVLAEEFGLLGGIVLLCIYSSILLFGIVMAFKCTSFFSKILILGVTYNFFTHYFVNLGMVMGILPVVGIPLPLMSYGGTSMMTLMFGFGLLMCAYTNREIKVGRRGHYDDD